MKSFLKISAAMFILFLLPISQVHALTPVDIELSLLVDVSSSVNSTEFNLQKQGYANAFTNASIISAIESGAHGAIAVSLTYWSSSNHQVVAVDWTLINDTASATGFIKSG